MFQIQRQFLKEHILDVFFTNAYSNSKQNLITLHPTQRPNSPTYLGSFYLRTNSETYLKINLSAILENVDKAAVYGSVWISFTNFQTASVFFLSKRLSCESDLSKASIRASVSKYKFSSVMDCLTQ